ncbi:MAG: DMT family transporter [Xenococcaceae cyanobacterium]
MELVNEFNLVGQYPGEIAALTAAFLWAVSSVVYSMLGRRIPPLQLNFLKGIIAIALLILTILLQGKISVDFPLLPLVFLALSGIVGIGLGDTAYFSALNNLGARRTLLMETLAPVMGALFALILLGEQLPITSWCGILLTLLGVAWVISEKSPLSTPSDRSWKKGIYWGLIAALTQAIGAVLSRLALVESTISPLWSSLIRLAAGEAIVFLLLLKSLSLPDRVVETEKNKQIQNYLSWRILGIITLAAFGSTYLGIWLQQISLKFAPTGIAQTLLSTSPLFIIPIAAIRGEKITIRSILGVAIALVGIGLLFSG